MIKRWLKPGDILLIAVVVVPVLLIMPSLMQEAWNQPSGFFRGLARLAGVIGLSLMLLAAMMSIRLPYLDRLFGGLPRLWSQHRWVGFLSFMLVMLHAWGLSFSVITRGMEPAMTVLFPPLSYWPVWMGWLALALMVAFLGPTFRFAGRLNYQQWKRLHLLSAPATVAALAHTLPLATYPLVWWFLGALAIGAIIWRKVLSPSLGQFEYEVVEVNTLVRGVVEISLKPRGKPIQYEAGQFVYLTPFDDSLSNGVGEEHPYTISSAPTDEYLKVGIKDLGDASRAIQTIRKGSRVQIEGPYGDFYERHYPQKQQLWLGGGIGITPFVSGARDMAGQEKPAAQVHLFYLANDPSRAYFTDELKEIAVKQPTFDLTLHLFREQRAMTAAFLQEHCPDYREREIYMCGPAPMINHLRTLLMHEGVPASAIHFEVFDFL
ncbi:ferredoxin reductase family protein [Nitrincola sp. MINF-07-Sa-05]|uniref:ferredoxin reductase family protein n=1 Tax=Nitrincola salilacus TaxID=3400273 RepID=UPI0039182D84